MKTAFKANSRKIKLRLCKRSQYSRLIDSNEFKTFMH